MIADFVAGRTAAETAAFVVAAFVVAACVAAAFGGGG